MKEIKLTLTIEEANTILEALGNLPFKQVFGLVGKIQNQAAAQINENGQAQQEAQPTAEIKK